MKLLLGYHQVLQNFCQIRNKILKKIIINIIQLVKILPAPKNPESGTFVTYFNRQSGSQFLTFRSEVL